MFRPALLPSVLLCAFCGFSPAADFPTPFNTEKGEPMPAEEAAATMKLPPGFKCVVFAAEPDVQQPIAMAWDARGRLWVAECYTYAENPDRWNTTLRDRIIILEDTDGDGKHDKRSVFWDQGSHLTSIENGYGGTWILNAGTLAFLPDKNGDDVPDSEPQILLDGFNTKTIGHNIVNGLRWGPDGWLYGRHGITDTSAVGAPGTPLEKRVKLNCAIWRYHPTRKVFETVAHGGTNSWGHDWNADGELFMINTVIGHLWHVIPGAYYRRMFGTHLNPNVYEVIEQTADHFHWDTGAEKWSDLRKGMSSKTSDLGGGHAHVGMMIYQGGHWPKEYHGAVMTCNLHGRRINVDTLVREGCGYTGKHAPDFMQAKDPWFRGIDLLTGPDGNVFVADWSDSGECHDNDGIHRTSGRIYKIVYGEPKNAEPIDVDGMKKEKLVKLLESENNWWVRTAQQKMWQMAASGYEPKLSTDLSAMRELAGKHFPINARLVALSTRNALGLPDGSMMTEHLADESEALRMNALKNQLTDKVFHKSDEAKVVVPLVKLAQTDPSGLVRLHLATALQRLPLEARWPIATALAQRAEDANDRQQPLMIWYGIEPAVAADPAKGVELIATAKHPTVRRLVARRITELIETHPAAVDSLVALLAKNTDATPDILSGMAAALEGWAQAPQPKGWEAFASSAGILPAKGSAGILPAKSDPGILPGSSETGKMPASHPSGNMPELLNQLNLVFGSGRALDELIALVSDPEADPNARSNAFKNLTRTAKPELLPIIRKLINDKILATAARSALAAYDDKDIPKALLQPWPVRSQEQQQASITTLITRPAHAHELLDAVAKGSVPAAAITPYQARQIRSLNDETLTQKLTAAWGELRDTPEAKQAEMAQWTKLLTPEVIAKADPAQGKAIFATACAACHKLYGEGGALGPELTGSDRHKLSYLLENILDPSAIVPADYRMTLLQLKDGRTLTGVIPEQTDRTLTVQTPAERLTIEKSQITTQQQLPISFMPEGLLTALGEDQVRHLIAYLMSTGPQ